MNSESSPILKLDNVTLGYELHPAVHHVSVAFEKGDLVAVVGPNGAGKSTFLKGIMGQLTPMAGQIEFDGVSRQQIAYLPQLSQVDRSFPITVQEMVALGAWHDIGAFGRLKSRHKSKVASALGRLGLQGFEKRLIGSLSGGQMQRVLFARLLVQEANLILLDEPFTGVDARTSHDLIHLIQGWQREGKTILAVLHDMEQVKHYFPKTLLLSRQTIGYGETSRVLTDENLQRARELNEAFDEQAEYCAHV